MKKIVLLLFIALMTLSLGCSKKKEEHVLKYTPEEFNHILGSIKLTADKNAANAVKISDYAPGANPASAQALVYERLSFSIIEFENEKQARDEAMRLNQYYSRNWLFDKVEGEPLLEDIVLSKFHGTNPKRRVQRKPISHILPGHGVEGGGGGGH
jgi:hypothetical protein